MKKIALALLCLWSGFVSARNTEQWTGEYLLETMKEVEQVVGGGIPPDLALKIAGCSFLAAHKDDPGKFGNGVNYSEIDAPKAIEVCKDAYHSSEFENENTTGTTIRAHAVHPAKGYALFRRLMQGVKSGSKL